MTKESESQAWTQPEALTTNGKINPDYARSDVRKVLDGLSDLGVKLNRSAKCKIINIKPLLKINDSRWTPIRQKGRYRFMDMPHPSSQTLLGLPLIRDSTSEYLLRSVYSITADMVAYNQPFQLFMRTIPEGNMPYGEPYHMSIKTSAILKSNKEMLLDLLPLNFTTVGFAYDLAQNPQYRDRLSYISQKRIPSEAVDNNRSRRSLVDGYETPEGIDARIRLHLQDPNPKDCLKCYEVEVRTKDNRVFSPDTPKLAPESIWQEKENHYCMVDGDSYPLSPITLDKISKLAMIINYRGDTPQVMFDLLGDLPLSIDWTNQWYASQSDRSKNGHMQLLFKPEWGDNNAAFVYHKSSKERILPEDIHNALKEMNTVKNTLTEKLAA